RSLDDMRAHHAELVDVARATGRTDLIAQALWLAHEPYWLAGDLDTDRAVLEESLAYAREHGAVFAHLSSLCDLAANALDRGDAPLARRHAADADAPSRVRGFALDRFKVLAILCETTLAAGEVSRAHVLARDAHHLALSTHGHRVAVESAT